MSTEVIAVLTFKSREHILSVGGTCSWALNRAHARQFSLVVCVRNANTRDAEGPEAHATGFLVGRIRDVVPSPENPARWLIAFSEYAEISVPGAWKGWRNPVRYSTLEELGLDPAELKFKPMPVPEIAPGLAAEDTADEEAEEAPFRLTLAQAKQGLANTFNVGPEAVEITIRA